MHFLNLHQTDICLEMGTLEIRLLKVDFIRPLKNIYTNSVFFEKLEILKSFGFFVFFFCQCCVFYLRYKINFPKIKIVLADHR